MKHYHIVSRIAIYLLSIVLIIFGVFHFKYPYDLLVYVPDFLVGGIRWAYVVGGAFILVGISFMTNRYKVYQLPACGFTRHFHFNHSPAQCVKCRSAGNASMGMD